MNRRFYLVLIIALVLGAVGYFRRPGLDGDLKTILSLKAAPRWTQIAGEILTDFARHSPRVKSWAINAPDSDAQITLYVFDSRGVDDAGLASFRNNCRYLGDGRRIVCDVALIRNMVAHFDLDKREETESGPDGHITRRYVVKVDDGIIEKSSRTMLTWVLGHELGHLVNKHRGQFYFQQHAFDKAVPAKSYCHKLELEADEYLLSVYPNQSKYEDLYNFLYDLVNREIHRQACPDKPLVLYCNKIYPGTGLALTEKPITYAVDKSHPDYVVRLLRIIDIIQRREDFGILAYQARQLITNGLVKVPGSAYYREKCSGE